MVPVHRARWSRYGRRARDLVSIKISVLGKRLMSVAGATGDTAFTVVDVASDARFRELRNVGPVAYFVWEQVLTSFPGLLAVRTTRPLAGMLPALRAAAYDINPALVLWRASAPWRCCSQPSGSTGS